MHARTTPIILLLAATSLGVMAPSASSAARPETPSTRPPADTKEVGQPLCPKEEAWFDGACRDLDWVRATFGSGSRDETIRGFAGDRRHDAKSPMVLVEQRGSFDGSEGQVESFTVVLPTRKKRAVIRDQGPGSQRPQKKEVRVTSDGPRIVGMALLGPSRGGYLVRSVDQATLRVLSNGWIFKSKVAFGVGKGAQANSLVLRDFETNLWDRASRHEICTPSGCSTAIASTSAGVTAADICADLVNSLETGVTLACVAATAHIGAQAGAIGGFMGGVLTAPETGGASIPFAILGGFVAGGVTGAGVGAGICPSAAAFILPNATLTSACTAALATPPSPELPDVLSTTSTTYDEDSQTCSVVKSVVIETGDRTNGCRLTSTYTCSGTTNSIGECEIGNTCTPEGAVGNCWSVEIGD